MERAKKNVRLGMTLPIGGADKAAELAKAAHGCGYEEIWMAEVNGGDSYALAGAVAQALPGVRIGTAVVPAQTRTPMAHAMAAMTLSQMTGGNFILGIGLSSPNIVRDWAGQRFDRPLTTMREHVEVLRQMLSGQKTSYEGKTLSVKGFRLGGAPVGSVPIYLGALNRGMLRLTGALCDGVCLNMVPESALPQVLAEVRAGAEEAGKDPGELEVVARLHVVMADDPAMGRNLIRTVFGAYAATPGYNKCFEWIGFAEEARRTLRCDGGSRRQGNRPSADPCICRGGNRRLHRQSDRRSFRRTPDARRHLGLSRRARLAKWWGRARDGVGRLERPVRSWFV